MKWFIYLIFILLYGLVTFFGLGPILLADGTTQERMITLLIVLFIYIIITSFFFLWRRRNMGK